MSKNKIKLIMELIFIFILPLLFICFTSEIQLEREFTYDNNGNYETSADTKKLSFDNSIIKNTNGYKNVINDFNKWDEQWSNGGINATTGQNEVNNNWIRSDNYINIDNTQSYYFYNLGTFYLFYYDSNKQFISRSNQYSVNQTITFNSNVYYIRFMKYGTSYSNNININLSVSWANGNYVPYGKPLILYTQTDVSGQNNINYTIWGNIKNLLINNLDLNDNVLLDIILCYMILWIINWIIWHIFYGFLELLIHIIPRKWERE